MRSYLLGKLEDSLAARIESRYFTNRSFLRFVQSVETALIEEYLDGKMAPETQRRFEARYCNVPELRNRMADVRAGRLASVVVPSPRPAQHWRWMLTGAGAVIITLAVAYYHPLLRVTPVPMASLTQPVAATLSLSPGVLKAGGTTRDAVLKPEHSGLVRFLLEIPGLRTPIVCAARLSVASTDGEWTRLWISPRPLWSNPSSGGQVVTLYLDTRLLHRGDYLIELLSGDGQPQESFLFRVVPE